MVLMSPKKDYTHKYKSTILILCEKEISVLIKALRHEGTQSARMTPCTVNLGTKQEVNSQLQVELPKAH